MKLYSLDEYDFQNNNYLLYVNNYFQSLNVVSCHLVSSFPDIPHFKQVIIMASNCDFCGYKTNEVKSGAGTSEYGTKITLHLTDSTDLSRDILKVCVHNYRRPGSDCTLQRLPLSSIAIQMIAFSGLLFCSF